MACALFALKFVSAFQIMHIEHSVSGPKLLPEIAPVLSSPIFIRAMMPMGRGPHQIFARERAVDPRKNVLRLFKLRRKMLKNQLWRLRKRHSMIHKALWSFKHRPKIGHVFPQSRFFRSFSLFRNKHPMFAFKNMTRKIKSHFKHLMHRFSPFKARGHHKKHHRRHRHYRRHNKHHRRHRHHHRRHHRGFGFGGFSNVFEHPLHRILRKMNKIDRLFSEDTNNSSLRVFATHKPTFDAQPFPDLNIMYPELHQFSKLHNNKLTIDDEVDSYSAKDLDVQTLQEPEKDTPEKFNQDIKLSVQPINDLAKSEIKPDCLQPELMVVADEGRNENNVQSLPTLEEAAPIKLHEGRRLAAVHKNQDSRKAMKILKSKKKLNKKVVAKNKTKSKKHAKAIRSKHANKKLKAHLAKKAKKANHARKLVQAISVQKKQVDSRKLPKNLAHNKTKNTKAKKAKKVKKAKKAKKGKHNKHARKNRDINASKTALNIPTSQKASAKSLISKQSQDKNKLKASLDTSKNVNATTKLQVQPSQVKPLSPQPPKQNVERNLRSTDEDYYPNASNRNYQSFDVQDYQKKLKHYKKPIVTKRRRLNNLAPVQPVMSQNLQTMQSAQNMAQTAIQQQMPQVLPVSKLPPSVMQVDNSIFSEEDQAKRFVLNLEKDMRQTRNAIDNIEDKLITMKRSESDIKKMLKILIDTKKKREKKALI